MYVYDDVIYLLKARGLSDKTVSNYLTALRLLERHTGKSFKEVGVDEVFSFLSKQTPPSRYMYAIALRSVFKLLGREDYVKIKIPKVRERKYTLISEEEVEKICMSLFNHKRKVAVAIALMYELALRVSELCNLRLNDLNLSDWTATVERIKSRRVYKLPIVSHWVKELLTSYISTHPRHTEYVIYSQ